MPTLDYSNPLFTFTKDNYDYTATQDCYALATIYVYYCQSYGAFYLNGYKLAYRTGSSEYMCTYFLKLTKGDHLYYNGDSPGVIVAGSVINIYKEK